MRIALVTPHATPQGFWTTSDRGPRVVPLAQALAQLGHAVTVYARKDSPALPPRLTAAPGVTIEHVPAGPPAHVPADELAPHVRSLGDYLARRWQQDVPDMAHGYSWPAGLAALAAGRDLGIPVTQTFHTLQAPGGRYRLRLPADQLARARVKVSLARSVDSVLARSSEEMRQLTRVGVPRTSIRVVPWGVDTRHFTPDGPAADRNGRARLITAWPFAGQHGPETAIRVLAEVPQAELLVVGGPPRAQLARNPVCRELNRLAAKLGVTGRVVFTGGVAWQDFPALLRSADLLVCASWEGLFDAVALQAMACGTPVVAPAAGFYPDAIIDGTTGLLVPPARPALLARWIRRLLDSPLQLEAFGIAAADRARSRYSWDRIARETVQAYQRCLPAPAPEPVEDEAAELGPAELAAAELAAADLATAKLAAAELAAAELGPARLAAGELAAAVPA
jgi:D-inositol-3-phosphate glycosyltransferase